MRAGAAAALWGTLTVCAHRPAIGAPSADDAMFVENRNASRFPASLMICSNHSTGHRIMIHNLHEKVVPTIQRASPEPPKGPHTDAVNAGHRDIHTNFTDQASMQHKDRGPWHNKLL